MVKITTASILYKPGGPRTAKQAGEGACGRWCQNCNSGTHNTDSCRGKCGFCDTGAVKKAAAGEGEKLTKAEKRRLNKMRKKKAEEAAKQADLNAVKKAVIETLNETDSEKYSPN